MATITVGDVTPRAQYTATSGQTVFAYTFPIFADGDLKVYIGSTLQTLTTHYTVAGAATSNGGSVTLVTGATTGDIVTIYRDIPVSRTSDYQASGDLLAETLNDDFDKTVMMAQQNESSLSLGLRVDQWDDYGDLTLPSKANRIGKVLAFNATTGNPEGGPTIADTNTVVGISADISTVAGIDTDVTTVATNSGYVAVVSGIESEIQSLHGIYTEIFQLGQASVVTKLNVLGQTSVVADMQLLADLEDGTVATNAIQDVAGIQANVTTVAGMQANVTTVAGKNTEIGLLGVGSTVANMATLGTNAAVADMSLLGTADNVADMDLLADLQNGAVATNALKTLAEIQDGTVATNAIKTVADDSAKITTLNGLSTEINALGALSTEISNLGNNATLQSDIALLGSSSVVADIETLADTQDGTIVSNGLSSLAATTTDIDNIFYYAIKDELIRILNSLPPGDSYLSTWLQANHTDGYARADFNTDGSIDTLNDLLLHLRYLGGIATSAEIATWTARIGTPSLSDTTLFNKYLDPNTVLPPFWTARLSIGDINTVATNINAHGLPVLVFSTSGNGLVPAPTASDIANNYVLRADGTWVAP